MKSEPRNQRLGHSYLTKPCPSVTKTAATVLISKQNKPPNTTPQCLDSTISCLTLFFSDVERLVLRQNRELFCFMIINNQGRCQEFWAPRKDMTVGPCVYVDVIL